VHFLYADCKPSVFDSFLNDFLPSAFMRMKNKEYGLALLPMDFNILDNQQNPVIIIQ